MANKDLRGLREFPKDLKIIKSKTDFVPCPEGWFYEMGDGLDCLIHFRDSGKYVRFQIPWRTIRAALRRKDK